MSLGILGILIENFFDYKFEITLGWLLPVFAGIATMYFINKALKKDSVTLTKTLAKGFALKMVYYGFSIFLINKLYSFQPIPFVCSFSGFFIGFHGLEAVVIKRISESYNTIQNKEVVR